MSEENSGTLATPRGWARTSCAPATNNRLANAVSARYVGSMSGLRSRRTGPAQASLPRGQLLLIFLLRQIDPPDPREAHLVDRALTVADPVLRVRVSTGVARVVVPADDVHDRPGRNQRCDIVRVVVNEVPVVIPVRAVDDLALHDLAGIRGINQLHALILAPDVHVRLERDDLARLGMQRVTVGADQRAGGDVQRFVRVGTRIAVVGG